MRRQKRTYVRAISAECSSHSVHTLHQPPHHNLRGGLARTKVRRAVTADSVASTVAPLGTTIQTPSSILSNTVPPTAGAARGTGHGVRGFTSHTCATTASVLSSSLAGLPSPVHSERVTTALPCTVVSPREFFTDGLSCDRTEASAYPARQPCSEFPPNHRSATGSALANSGCRLLLKVHVAADPRTTLPDISSHRTYTVRRGVKPARG